MLKVIPINDNITLNYISMDKLKTTTLGMYIHRPLKREEASKNAILPHILKRGNRLLKNTQEIATYLEDLYGAKFSAGISKKGDSQLLCFEGETISDKYAPNGESLTGGLLKLILSCVFDQNESFQDEVFSQERTNSITKIENIINDKRVYAIYRCQEEMSKGDSFAIPRLGYVDDMKKMTKEELYDYYREIITSSPIDIYVCGDTDLSLIEDEIIKAIDGYKFEKAVMPKSEILKKKDKVNNVTERLDVTQGKLAIGFLTEVKPTDDDYYTMVVANAIFGGGAQSKLFNNVREKLSLAYYAGSMLNKYKGMLLVNAGIEFENFQKAYDETLVQLEEVKNGNISDLEIESSKQFLINSLVTTYDDQMALISFYLNQKIVGSYADIEECIERIKPVTKEDVARIMKKVHLDTVYFLAGEEAL